MIGIELKNNSVQNQNNYQSLAKLPAMIELLAFHCLVLSFLARNSGKKAGEICSSQ